ncbi:MAG TPA: hypothetical protein PK597_02650, partial [Oscillospiraceae bacterium]|nr:hypothetical protein [Oscillospiraceae bacterium]
MAEAAPVWTSGGADDCYLLAADEVHHYDALGDFLKAMNDTFASDNPVQLVFGRYFQNQLIENADASPTFTAIRTFYDAELALFLSDNQTAAAALAETCRAGGA